MVNYYQIIQDLSGIAYHHPQINSFGYGDITQITMDVETNKEPVYARMYVVPGDVIIRQNRLNINLNIIVMDIINDDYSNQLEVMSDTLETIKDIWTILYQSYTAQYGGFTIDYEPLWSPEVEPFLERFESVLGGHTIRLTIELPYDYNTCVIPDTEVFPQDQSFSSYYQVVEDFENFAKNHKQLNSYGFGDLTQFTNDIETKKEPIYPKMYFIPQTSRFDPNHMHIRWHVLCMDQLNADLSNQREVMSDTLQTIIDLFSRAYLSDYESDWDALVTPWIEQTETTLCGWLLDMSITQKFDFNRCVLPETPFVATGKKWYELAELWNNISTSWKKT
jgi:hypothetical protein